jgi:hypothetical protein
MFSAARVERLPSFRIATMMRERVEEFLMS